MLERKLKIMFNVDDVDGLQCFGGYFHFCRLHVTY